jgi:hypothetical protein
MAWRPEIAEKRHGGISGNNGENSGVMKQT